MERNSEAKELQDELLYYTTLLKDYNRKKLKEKLAAAKQENINSSTNFSRKQSFNAFKVVRSIPQNGKAASAITNCQQKSKISHLYKAHNPHTYFKDKRRILSSGSKSSVLVQSEIPRNESDKRYNVSQIISSARNGPSNAFKNCKRTVCKSLNSDLKASHNKCFLVSKEESIKLSSHPLVAEIAALTKQLKQTSESLSSNKSKLAITNTRFNSKKLTNQNCDNSKKAVAGLYCKNIAVDKKFCYVPTRLTSAVQSSFEQDKKKRCYVKQSVYRALKRSPSKVSSNTKLDNKVIEPNLLIAQSKNIPSVNSLSEKNHNEMSSKRAISEISFSNSALSGLSKYRSPLVKKGVLSNRKKSKVTNNLITSKYKIVNKNLVLNHTLKLNSSLQKTPKIKNGYLSVSNLKFENNMCKKSSSKKTQKKLNLKHKIINKTLTPCITKKGMLKFESIKILEKNKPIMQMRRQSSAENLLNKLRAKSNKSFVNRIGNVITSTSPRTSLKSPIKVSCVLNSKYKVINKNCNSSRGKVTLQLKNVDSANDSKNKVSRFSVINKSAQSKNSTPLFIDKPVLLKRVFKSKNVIINKNYKPLNYTARMIKTKYFTLNRKRPISSQNIPKMAVANRLKGHFLNGHYYPRSLVFTKKANAVPFNQNVYRQHLQQRTSLGTKHFSRKNFTSYKQCSLLQNKQFTVNSSGKKLKRITSFNGKVFKRISVGKAFLKSNGIKSASPICKAVASRVLHRSINRALTASVKKEMTKVNKYCMFYNRFGRCNKGIKCSYIHDPSKIAVCTRFLRGTCKINGCPFSHEVCPGKMAICSFFLVGSCNKSDCPYRHETLSSDTELCKAFVQGYCQSGKECKKAHILICPQYVQGICNKGESCAFPHPPQKDKKNVQGNSLDKNISEDPQELYEKVTRYFQPFTEVSMSENKDKEKYSIIVVSSRSYKLPEQPSYIPLTDISISSSLQSLPQQPSFLSVISDDDTS